jgi:hypothetical protein
MGVEWHSMDTWNSTRRQLGHPDSRHIRAYPGQRDDRQSHNLSSGHGGWANMGVEWHSMDTWNSTRRQLGHPDSRHIRAYPG